MTDLFNRMILKALQEKRISLNEAKVILKHGVPLEFWIEDEFHKLPIRRQAYCEVYGRDLPMIKFVD